MEKAGASIGRSNARSRKSGRPLVETETRGLFDSDDAETLWEGMVPDSAVIALAIEHTWAIDL